MGSQNAALAFQNMLNLKRVTPVYQQVDLYFLTVYNGISSISYGVINLLLSTDND
jgi:hypothetical protein